MKRIIAAIAVAAGLLLGTVGFAQPAAAYNNAPASSICNWKAASFHFQPTYVTYCQDINWFGHYAVRGRQWTPSMGANGCGGEWVYDRHTGQTTWITSWCS